MHREAYVFLIKKIYSFKIHVSCQCVFLYLIGDSEKPATCVSRTRPSTGIKFSQFVAASLQLFPLGTPATSELVISDTQGA